MRMHLAFLMLIVLLSAPSVAEAKDRDGPYRGRVLPIDGYLDDKDAVPAVDRFLDGWEDTLLFHGDHSRTEIEETYGPRDCRRMARNAIRCEVTYRFNRFTTAFGCKLDATGRCALDVPDVALYGPWRKRWVKVTRRIRPRHLTSAWWGERH